MKSFCFKLLVFFMASLFLVSCASKKDVLYLQNIDQINSNEGSLSYEPKLQNDDLLSIIVAADQPELTVPFNLPQIQGNYQINQNQDGIKTYLIDIDGNIVFPVIGKVKLAGLTRSQAVRMLEEKIKEYITNPSVNLRILNYKFSVIGEVNRPGTFKIESERVTLLEALSQAGDLTIYGNRSNILIIREVGGKKEYNRVDITKADFINSPFYYLVQNDVVVVEPNKTRVNSSVVGPNLNITISAISLLTTILLIITR